MQEEETSSKYDNNGTLREDTFPEELLKCIKNIIKEEGYVKHQVSTRAFATDGGNYLGKLYEVDIQGQTNSGNKETNIFIKYIPDDRYNVFSVPECYYKEYFIYKELSKIFDELQNEAQVPAQARFKMAKSYEATSTEAIFLENLTNKGFTTLHRMDVMPLKFAQLAVQELAKFHGLSYILQEERPQFFNTNVKVLKQHLDYGRELNELLVKFCNKAANDLSHEAKEKLEKFMPKMFEKFTFCSQDTVSIGCTICHGDYKVNNILVKKENNENITDIVLIDYQFLHYGSPINDLIFFLFTGSDQEFRRNHLEDLKNMYYDNLDTFLGYFNMDINEIYPRKEFESQYRDRLYMGLIYALYCTPFIFKDDNATVGETSTDENKVLGFVLDDRYRERIQGVVDDFINWGYL